MESDSLSDYEIKDKHEQIREMNPMVVFDILKFKLRNIQRYAIYICGGDGTACWVMTISVLQNFYGIKRSFASAVDPQK